jgi:hypothetical protein
MYMLEVHGGRAFLSHRDPVTAGWRGMSRRTTIRGNALSLTIWLRFCCDCGPEEPAGGGPCCDAMAL